jgi:DNA-binding beta-propeller fold protein YncE
MQRTHAQTFRRLLGMLVLVGAACSLMACSATKVALPKGPFFYPQAPDEPRIQFLTGFGDSSLIEKTDSFALILAGGRNPEDVIKLIKPYGIAVYKGNMYVCDTISRTVYLINPFTKRFESLRGNAGSAMLKKPVNLTVDEQGKLYVVDSERNEIVTYSTDGDYLGTLGKGIIVKPVAVAVDNEFVYVVDIKNNVVKLLDKKSGELVREIGANSNSEADSLALPVGIAIDKERSLYITNVGSGKMLKMDIDSHLLLSFGRIGDGFGEFARPKGIAVADDGIIYVVDAGFQNVHMYTPEGRLLMYFGTPGQPRGSLNLPAAIFVTKDNLEYYSKFADPTFQVEYLIFLINQQGDDKVAIYGYGHRKGATSESVGTGSGNDRAR